MGALRRAQKVNMAEAKIFKKDGKPQATADSYENFVSRTGIRNDNALSGGHYRLDYVTKNRIQLEAAYRGSWIVGAVIESVAEDMTRAGVDVTTNEGDEDIKDLQAAISRFKIWQSLCSVIKWGRLYGGAVGVIYIEGQDLSTPLDLDTIAEGQFQGVVSYDRWQLDPDLSRVIKSGPDLGLPEYYSIVNNPSQSEPTNPTPTGGQAVHHSRCIRIIGYELPYWQAITEMMWGESILERMWDRLIAFDEVTMSSASLVDRANLRTVKIANLREIIASGGKAQEALEAMFDMMRLAQVNEGLTLLDKEDEFAATPYTFAGLSDMMLQFGQQLSGASGIPLIRLFGQAPAGLSATGESDIRMYYDNINAQQEAKLRAAWDKLLKVLWRSEFGAPAPKDLEFTFTPLWQMSALDKAAISKSNTETILGAFEGGLISRETGMKELRQSSGDTGLFSNITDEEIKEAEEEEPPMPEAEPSEQQEPADTPKDPVKNIDSAFTKIKNWVKGKK